MEAMKIAATIVAIGIVIVGIYFLSKFAKSMSYNVFYEDMVKQTIQETVKKDCLK